MNTNNCYIVLYTEISGIKMISDKIYGYKNIMMTGKKRDHHNMIAKHSTSVPYLNIEERFGFTTFQELDDLYKQEQKK